MLLEPFLQHYHDGDACRIIRPEIATGEYSIKKSPLVHVYQSVPVQQSVPVLGIRACMCWWQPSGNKVQLAGAVFAQDVNTVRRSLLNSNVQRKPHPLVVSSLLKIDPTREHAQAGETLALRSKPSYVVHLDRVGNALPAITTWKHMSATPAPRRNIG